ncbi:hypothetical protein [Bdellovibrio sp. HCB-110]|uniref:hypothetical protein n=1 Tax=Bdellovibrio sp. HCB-110 TaxID=3391182 RepID=UPI0039B3D995
MKKSILLSLCLILSGTSAFADCKVAVGGPGTNFNALIALSSSLQSMFESQNLSVNTFPVSSLPDALSSDADYIVYLKSDFSTAVIQFRDILLNRVMLEKRYPLRQGLNETINQASKDIAREVIPQLPRFCKK